MTRMILALLNDLFLLPRIEDVARKGGFQIKLVSKPQDLGISQDPVKRPVPLTEALTGPEGSLIRQISALQPGLILVDATAKGVPWLHWIQILKTSAATRRIPILVFGPHVEKELLDRASAMGADAVVSRGVFHKRMEDLITRYDRPDPTEALRGACEGVLAEKAREGIKLHNLGEHYQAHELLEEAWMQVPEMEGYLYRALIQLTVAYLHLSRGNIRGAKKMVLRIHQWLDPLPDTCRTVDVADLKQQVSELRHSLNSEPLPSNLRPIRIQLVS